MKKYLIAMLAFVVASLSLLGIATAEDNPYYAGYMACQSKYDEKNSTEYSNCIAKAKCEVDNPGEKAYCECIGNGGVKLNTNVPFVGRCINKNDTQDAFPSLIGGISRMVVTAILIISFMMIIAGGVMWTSGNAKGGKGLITKVVIGLAILGASGAILRLINPNFFK